MARPEDHRGRDRVERCGKWVRTYLGGRAVVDSRSPLLVWEVPYYPSYYFPVDDVRADLVPTGEVRHSTSRGDAEVFDVHSGSAIAKAAAWRYRAGPIEELRDAVRFQWDAMDEWLEEDEPVYTHARSPYARVDILHSSRHVRVVLDGAILAESDRPAILFETGLPPRYYLPLCAFNMDVFRPSASSSHCPYKGTAGYWSVEIDGKSFEDLVWIYRAPLPESQKIAGMASFYNERVDIYVDGELQERPRTKFS